MWTTEQRPLAVVVTTQGQDQENEETEAEEYDP